MPRAEAPTARSRRAARAIPGKLPSTKLSDDSRERLLQAAIRLFAERGLDGVSVKELAQAAQVNVSLVSYHFGGKEALYRSCVEAFGRERLAFATRALQAPASLEEMRVCLRMFYDEFIRCHLVQPEICQIIHRECERGVPLVEDIFRETFLKVFETFVGFVGTAQKRGLIDPKIDVTLASHLIFGCLVQVTRGDPVRERYYGTGLSDSNYREQLLSHLLLLTTRALGTGPAASTFIRRK